MVVLAQAAGQVTPLPDRLPAEAPLAGPLWSLVVPAVLFGVAFLATWLLYRRFAREADRAP